MAQPPEHGGKMTALTPMVFQILLALADGERHGYAIVQEVARASDGKIRLGAGNLYRTLRGMRDQGLIEESDERPGPAEDDTRRRYYRLTDFGQRATIAEAQRLAQVVAQARSKPLLQPALDLALAQDGGLPR